MLRPVRTNRFKKDVERARKRGNDLNKLRAVMEKLIAEEPLETWHRGHPLVGGYAEQDLTPQLGVLGETV